MIWATRGGVVLGIGLLIWQGFVTWRAVGGRKGVLKSPVKAVGKLLPFVLAWAYGALGVLAVMGLIGWAFDALLWVSNWLGDAARWIGVGNSAGVSSRGSYLPLTEDGRDVVLLATIAFFAAVKFTPASSDLKRGAWCGACLGTASGVAGLAAVPLAQGANHLGFLALGWTG